MSILSDGTYYQVSWCFGKLSDPNNRRPYRRVHLTRHSSDGGEDKRVFASFSFEDEEKIGFDGGTAYGFDNSMWHNYAYPMSKAALLDFTHMALTAPWVESPPMPGFQSSYDFQLGIRHYV